MNIILAILVIVLLAVIARAIHRAWLESYIDRQYQLALEAEARRDKARRETPAALRGYEHEWRDTIEMNVSAKA